MRTNTRSGWAWMRAALPVGLAAAMAFNAVAEPTKTPTTDTKKDACYQAALVAQAVAYADCQRIPVIAPQHGLCELDVQVKYGQALHACDTAARTSAQKAPTAVIMKTGRFARF